MHGSTLATSQAGPGILHGSLVRIGSFPRFFPLREEIPIFFPIFTPGGAAPGFVPPSLTRAVMSSWNSWEIWVSGSAWREPAAIPWKLLRGRKRGWDLPRILWRLRGFPALSRGRTGLCSHPAASVSLGSPGSAQPLGWFSHLGKAGIRNLGILRASGSLGSLRKPFLKIRKSQALPQVWFWLRPSSPHSSPEGSSQPLSVPAMAGWESKASEQWKCQV